MRRIHVLIVLVFIAMFPGANAVRAQSGPATFVSFDEFVKGVSAASFESYALRKDAGVKRVENFDEMRRHILSMYEGVTVAHSFIVDEQYFDCIPIEQQPSVRSLGLKQVVVAPPAPSVEPGEKSRTPEGGGAQGLPSLLTLGLVDTFGNAVSCEEGTIPMRRITLKETSRFETLEKFFHKTPWGKVGQLLSDGEALTTDPPVPAHRYAHAAQTVKNYGGNSWLNLWSPSINGNASQIFSLSQHWYYGGRGRHCRRWKGDGRRTLSSTIPPGLSCSFIGPRTTIRTRVATTWIVRRSCRSTATGSSADRGRFTVLGAARSLNSNFSGS